MSISRVMNSVAYFLFGIWVYA